MTIYFAVAVDLEIFSEETSLFSFIVIESMGIFGPGGDLEIDAE